MARIKYYDEETGAWKYADKQYSAGSGSGQDGFSPIAKVEQTADGAVISITDKNGITTATITNGKDGADGKTPVKGTDYYTEADKTEMVNMVLAALPTWTGGNY